MWTTLSHGVSRTIYSTMRQRLMVYLLRTKVPVAPILIPWVSVDIVEDCKYLDLSTSSINWTGGRTLMPCTRGS